MMKTGIPEIATRFVMVGVMLFVTGAADGQTGSLSPLPQVVDTFPGPVASMEFVVIPSGSFMMGSPSSEEGRNDDESPSHTVYIDSFQLMTTEVTQGMWEKVMGTSVQDKQNFEGYDRGLSGTGDDYPMYYVSWNDCQEFIDKLNDLDSNYIYRLPSESEWEYACRAGTTTGFYWGDSVSESIMRYLWFEWNTEDYSFTSPEPRLTTQPVGTKEPNAWGLYDMSGNVYEWCLDQYHDNYDGAPTDGSAWESSGGSHRVKRGGCFFSHQFSCRSADRSYCSPDCNYDYLGFRLVREVATFKTGGNWE